MTLIDIGLVYNEIPLTDAMMSLVVVAGVFITYIFRKIFPFNVIWGFLMVIFIYALINYFGKKIKEWFN